MSLFLSLRLQEGINTRELLDLKLLLLPHHNLTPIARRGHAACIPLHRTVGRAAVEAFVRFPGSSTRGV